MFFCTTKDYLIKSLELIGKQRCVYILGKYGRCDCKYGFAEEGTKMSGETSGHPEVMCAKEVIEALTPVEWNRILKRLKKSHVHADEKCFIKIPKKKRKKKC